MLLHLLHSRFFCRLALSVRAWISRCGLEPSSSTVGRLGHARLSNCCQSVILIGLLPLLSGCQVFRLAQITTRNEHRPFPYFSEEARDLRRYRVWAHDAWLSARANMPPDANAAYFEAGFLDGFTDYCFAGGDGKAPLIPPRYFWSLAFRNEYGDGFIMNWQAGYEQGAYVARDAGYRQRAVLPALDPGAGTPRKYELFPPRAPEPGRAEPVETLPLIPEPVRSIPPPGRVPGPVEAAPRISPENIVPPAGKLRDSTGTPNLAPPNGPATPPSREMPSRPPATTVPPPLESDPNDLLLDDLFLDSTKDESFDEEARRQPTVRPASAQTPVAVQGMATNRQPLDTVDNIRSTPVANASSRGRDMPRPVRNITETTKTTNSVPAIKQTTVSPHVVHNQSAAVSQEPWFDDASSSLGRSSKRASSQAQFSQQQLEAYELQAILEMLRSEANKWSNEPPDLSDEDLLDYP